MVLIQKFSQDLTATPIDSSTITAIQLVNDSGSNSSPNTLNADVNEIEYENTSGSPIELIVVDSLGAYLFSVGFMGLGSAHLHCILNAGQSIGLRASGADADQGVITMNFMKGPR